MITEELFERILVAPAMEGGDELLVVSGYASGLMAQKHFDYLRTEAHVDLKLRLVVGMASEDGIYRGDHRRFLDLRDDEEERFECTYVVRPHSVHSKVYIWQRDGRPIRAWSGSANYTQFGFGLQAPGGMKRHEVLNAVTPENAHDYFHKVLAKGVRFDDEDIDSKINFTFRARQQARTRPSDEDYQDADETLPEVSVLESVVLPLYVQRTGQVHERSGLNWGQREGRDPNQAYIPIPSGPERDSDFFPPAGTYFTVRTDDGQEFVLTRAQAEGKALHTPRSNALLGRYIRRRLGVPSGTFVTREMLDRYGADSITIYKVDDEDYILSFSPST